jgi:predicted flap endonuclease-1-like 5' DNA nuclease
MYLLSQLWLYLLLACLAGLALGLLLNRVCQQRRHAAQLDALQREQREDRSRHELALTGLQGEHARTLETLTTERGVLQARLDTLGADHHESGERVRALSASVDQHQVVRQGLGEEVEALQVRLDEMNQSHQSLQTLYESRLSLLNTETSRAASLADQLSDLQARHAALEVTHRDTLARQAEVAKEAYDALMTAQAERDTAREAAAATETGRQQERQAALLAAGATAGATLMTRQKHQDEVAALQAELAAGRERIAALQGEVSHHQALLSAEAGRGVALRESLTGLQGAHALAVSAHDDAVRRAAESIAGLQGELDAARQAAAAAEAERQRERQAALLAAGATAGATLMTRQKHQDEVASLQAELVAGRERIAALQGAQALAVSAHDDAARRAAESIAGLQAELDAARQAAVATEAEWTRERQAATLAAGVAAAAALASRQSHQDELAVREQQCAERAAQRDRRIAELQGALDEQELAWRAAEAQAQALRDAQAALQSAAQLREQALQQELAQSQARGQELDAELRSLRLTLAENDEQLATLGHRLQAERDQQASLTLALADAVSRAAPPPPPVIERPAPSSAALMSAVDLERLVMAAGAGQQPAPVEIDEQRPDDLKLIDGIGPVNERWLHAQGVHYFWQIACWAPEELAWVANHLPNFGSRVYRENWVAQAAKLAAQQRQRSLIG